MKDVLGAAVIALLLGIVAGPAFIAFLRRNEFGQHIREDGPAGHHSKQGTPTMGGVMLIGCAAIAFLIFSRHYSAPGMTVLGVTLACGAIGFADDYLSLRRRRSLGLSGRWKMLLLGLVALVLGLVVHHEHLGTDVYLPLINQHLALGPFYYVLLFLVVAGATNAVNLTDGLDGLAAGTTTIALAAYSAIMLVAFLVSQPAAHPALRPNGDVASLDLAIISAALVGGAIGFLWYNAYPADVFMGDTGSFGLGGALAAMAVMTKTEVLLVVIGGVFVIEALSVVIQVVSFKFTGKRVFLMAPLHHHFEMMEWTENKIIVRFWIFAAICGASGFVLYYLYFSSYQ